MIYIKQFGNKSVFLIGYEFQKNPFNEPGILGVSWGTLELFIDGKNLFLKRKNGKNENFHWNLIYMAEWFHNNLKFLIIEDEFPVKIKGNDSIELLDNFYDSDIEDDDSIDKVYDWNVRHSWFADRAGAFVPRVYFRKVQNQIEVSWDNKNLYDECKILFNEQRGRALLDISYFKHVIDEFLLDFKSSLAILIKTDESQDLQFEIMKN